MRDVFESTDPDFNEAEGVTCPDCKAPYEMVRPGKIQPTCLCEAYRVECANHQTTRELLEQLRAKVAESEKKKPVQVSDQMLMDGGFNLFALHLFLESIGKRFKANPTATAEENSLAFSFTHRSVDTEIKVLLTAAPAVAP